VVLLGDPVPGGFPEQRDGWTVAVHERHERFRLIGGGGPGQRGQRNCESVLHFGQSVRGGSPPVSLLVVEYPLDRWPAGRARLDFVDNAPS
jgi:hypothetical protein